MTIRRLAMAFCAVAFAAFSSVAMLQSARPAMAAPSWNHSHQQRVADRDDRRRHDRDDRKHHPKVNKGRHVGWNNPHNPHNVVKPKHHPDRDHR